MAAALPPIFTIEQAMLQCGVPDAPLYEGLTPAERIANDIFVNSFETTLSISIQDVNDAMTAFTKLTVINGKISLQPGVRRRVTAFVQWTRSMLRYGNDPTLRAFPVANIADLMNDLQTCTRFEKQSDVLVAQSTPKNF